MYVNQDKLKVTSLNSQQKRGGKLSRMPETLTHELCVCVFVFMVIKMLGKN